MCSDDEVDIQSWPDCGDVDRVVFCWKLGPGPTANPPYIFGCREFIASLLYGGGGGGGALDSYSEGKPSYAVIGVHEPGVPFECHADCGFPYAGP